MGRASGLVKDACGPGLWPSPPNNPTHQHKLYCTAKHWTALHCTVLYCTALKLAVSTVCKFSGTKTSPGTAAKASPGHVTVPSSRSALRGCSALSSILRARQAILRGLGERVRPREAHRRIRGLALLREEAETANATGVVAGRASGRAGA